MPIYIKDGSFNLLILVRDCCKLKFQELFERIRIQQSSVMHINSVVTKFIYYIIYGGEHL